MNSPNGCFIAIIRQVSQLLAFQKCFIRLSLLALFGIAASAAQAGTLISFATPQNGYVATSGGSFTATLQLTGSANPATLQVSLGVRDVTSLFQDKCSQAPCNITVTLGTSSGVLPGQNYLTAKIRGANYSVDQARLRFVYHSGLQDPTTGPSLGHFVPVQQTGTTITVMTPIPQVVEACSSAQVRLAVFDRTNLNLLSSKTGCYPADATIGAILGTLDQSDLIIINAASGSGTADFTNMGGNSSQVNKAGYYAVGFGSGTAGTAFEAWQEAADDGSHPKTVNGVLTNVGCSTGIAACTQEPSLPAYIFQPTNSMGFAIIPGATGASGSPGLPTIYVGNPKSLPLNSNDPPPGQQLPTNFVTQRTLFDYQAYTPSWTGGNSAGGFFLVTLNRSDLTLYSQAVYVTNCNCSDHTNDNNQIQQLATALGDTNPNRLFLLTTIGAPFNADSATLPLLQAVAALGTPASALQATIPDYLGTPASPGFSMIGYPGTVSGSQKGGSSVTGPVTNNVSDTGPLKLYSSSANIQQDETGALRGIFAKKHSAYYEADNVSPFTESTLPVYATGDDILGFSLSSVLGTTEPVAWPEMDTTAKKNAYAYLSNELLSANLKDSKCSSYCGDIRFYYTSTSASTIYTPLQPASVPYPGDEVGQANGFTSADFIAVQQQLQLEASYLKTALAFELSTELLNSNDDVNVGSAMRSAGATVTNDLEITLGTPAATVDPTPIKISQDTFATLGAVTGIIPNVPALQVISGIFNTTANVLGFIQDMKAQKPQPDPYVTQLSQLTATDTDSTESEISRYSDDVLTASNIFYNGVYSDWFRLQSVALLATDQDNGGWFLEDATTDRKQYLKSLSINERVKLYEQILPQYFSEAAYTSVATGFVGTSDGTDTTQTFQDFLTRYGGPQAHTTNFNSLNAYSWDARTSPSDNWCQDYYLVFLKNKWNTTWPNDFGEMLFGDQTASDGVTPELDLDQNFVLDRFSIPWWTSGVSYPQAVNDQTKGNHNTSWRCAAWGQYRNSNPTTFSNLSASQAIAPGATIFVYGTILGSGNRIPPGNVQISIGTAQSTVWISQQDGGFSANVDTSHLEASPAPYTITYSYAGSAAFGGSPNNSFAATYDISTTLTVNSSNTDIELAAPNGNTITYPQAASLQVTVKSPAGVPTGSVTFYSDGVTLGTVNLVASGTSATASFSATGLTGGAHTISAQFFGTGSYQNSSSNELYLTVNRNSVVLVPIGVPNSISFGTSDIIIAGSLASSDGKPLPDGQSVGVTIAGTQLSTTITGGKGEFILNFPTATLTAGNYTINYAYAGNINLLPLSDNSHQLQVVKVLATVGSLTPSQSIPAGTQSLPLSGTLVGVTGFAPTGTIVATIDGISSDVGTLQGGIFSLHVPAASIPPSTTPYKVAYQYSGDSNYLASLFDSTTLTVSPVVTTTTLTSSAPSVGFGGTVILTATVQPVPSIAPLGSVTFYDGNTPLGDVVPLHADGTAALQISSLAIGTHVIKAVYSAATFYSPSTSNTVSLDVDDLTTVVYATQSPATVAYGNATVYLSGQIAGKSGQEIVDYPVGQTLTITIGAISQNFTLQKFGVFETNFPILNFPVGTYPIRLDFAGDSRFASMTDTSLQLTIGKGTPVFSHLTANPVIGSGASSVGLSGVITAQPSTGSILQFKNSNNDGVGGVVLPYDTTGVSTDGATYSVWINTTNKAHQMLFQVSNSHPIISMTGDQLIVWWGYPDQTITWESDDTRPISDGQWHHIAVTFNHGKMTLYKDGVATDDAFTVTTAGNADTPLNLGGSFSGIASFLGEMWNAKIWSKPLAAADIQQDMFSIYGGNLPNGLKFLSAFNQSSNSAMNVVNGATVVTPGNPATDPQIAADSLPAQYPDATEQVLVTVNGQNTLLTIGANGAFAGNVTKNGLDAGRYPITYEFGGDTNFIQATDNSTSLTVQSASTTTTVTSSNSSAGYNTQITFTATVAPLSGNDKPAGNVTFYDGTTAISPKEPLAEGVAQFPTSSLTVGTHSITAVYEGSTDYATSTSPAIVQKVVPADTTVSLTSTGSPSDYGTPITFTAQVSSSGGIPDGTVTFLDGSTPLPPVKTLDSDGKASTTIMTLTAGQHSITASYSGSTNFSASTGALTQTVNYLVPTFISLAYPQPIFAGTPSVTLGGTIAAGSSIPVGATVSISVNNIAANPPAIVQSDGTFSAQVDTHALGLGSYAVVYNFAATGNFKGISDSSTRLTVLAASTTTALTSSAPSADYGTPVTLTATVSNIDSTSTPTGTVTFSDGSNPIGSPVVLAGGKASYHPASLAVGSHSITAVYAPDTTVFSSSTSAAMTETINLLPTAFSNLTPSQTLTNGVSNINLSGTISSTPVSGSVLQYLTATTTYGSGILLQNDATGVSTDGATYSMWIKTTCKTEQILFQIPNFHPIISMTGDQLNVSWGYPDQESVWHSDDTRPISDGYWHHIAVVFNHGVITLYKDGVATDDSFPVPTEASSDANTNLGGSVSSVAGFLGQMWNAKIWAGALSASDITTDMYQTYSGGIPANLRLLTSFDAKSNTAINLVNGQVTTIDSGTLASIASATLPAYYPVDGEQISIAIDTQTPLNVIVGAGGSFTASVPVSNLSAGSHSINYGYKGNAYLAPSTDGSSSVTVQNTATATIVTSSSPTADYGTPVTFKASVSSKSGITPTGTVQFSDGNTAIGSVQTLDSAGNAQIPSGLLAVGPHIVTATYTSNVADFSGSTSAPITETINKLTPVFTNLAAPSITAGTATVSLGGSIAAGTFIPTGDTVTIILNGTSKPGPINNDGSFSANFDTSALAAGSYGITYSYAGSANFNGASNGTTTLTVTSSGPFTPQLTVTASPNPAVEGQNISLSAKVQQFGSVVPEGNVTFAETVDINNQPLKNPNYWTGVDVIDGTATILITATTNPPLTVGIHRINATFCPTVIGVYECATSPNYDVTVNPSVGGSDGAVSVSFANGNNGALTVAPGDPANFPLTVKSLTGYTGGVAITCTPQDAVSDVLCSVSPSLVTLASGPQTATITITTVNGVASNVRMTSFLISGLVFASLAFRRKRRVMVLLAAVLVASLGVGGCGGHASNVQYATPGTYKFTITASSTSGVASTSTITATVIVKNK
jgi:hypothetical protein